MEDLSGQYIGKYQILEEIGRGSVAVVYKGRDPDQDRLAAIKVLVPQLATDKDFAQCFLRQAHATAQLEHPHIIVVFDMGHHNGLTWMAMAYLEGIPLQELIRLQGPMLSSEAHAVVRKLASALDYVHGADLLHGDVRSGNVMVCPPGRVLLTELGVVRTRWEGKVAGGKVSAAIAPEQIAGESLGSWTDLYALGALTYEMLGGRPAYTSDTTAGLLSQIVHDVVPPIRPLRPDLPAAVEPVLEKAMAKNPQVRYRSGAEFAAALGEALLVSPGAVVETRATAEATPPAETAVPPALRGYGVPAEAELPAFLEPELPAAAELPAFLEPELPAAAERPALQGTAMPFGAEPPALPEAELPAEAALAGALPTAEEAAPSFSPPDPSRLPPWQAVPIGATPSPEPAPKATALNRTPQGPDATADQIAGLRAGKAHVSSTTEKRKRKRKQRTPVWVWLLLGVETVLLLAGIALIVLLLMGIL